MMSGGSSGSISDDVSGDESDNGSEDYSSDCGSNGSTEPSMAEQCGANYVGQRFQRYLP